MLQFASMVVGCLAAVTLFASPLTANLRSIVAGRVVSFHTGVVTATESESFTLAFPEGVRATFLHTGTTLWVDRRVEFADGVARRIVSARTRPHPPTQGSTLTVVTRSDGAGPLRASIVIESSSL